MLVCRFVSPFVSLVGWLLVSMCACVLFGTLRHIFVSYSHFGRLFCAFLALWEALRLHCNAWGSTLPPLVTYFYMFFVLGALLQSLGALFVDLWAPFGHLWGPFWCVFVALWPDPGPLFRVFWKRLGKLQKEEKKAAGMDVFSMIFQVFPETGKVRFDCAGASGLRFRPLIFWLCASIFALFFLHCFFVFFGPSWGPRSMRSS